MKRHFFRLYFRFPERLADFAPTGSRGIKREQHQFGVDGFTPKQEVTSFSPVIFPGNGGTKETDGAGGEDKEGEEAE